MLQCLLGTEPWCEEGAHWSVKYLHLRVLDIEAEVSRAKRSAQAAARLSRSCSFGWRRHQSPQASKLHKDYQASSFEKLRDIFDSSYPHRSPFPFRKSTELSLLKKAPSLGDSKLLSSEKDVDVIGSFSRMSTSGDRPIGLLKSRTDSALKLGYGSDQIEADGSQHYILPDGSMDLETVLLATAIACRRHSSLRVCQSSIQLIHSLVLLGVFRSARSIAHVPPVVAAALAGDEHRRILKNGPKTLGKSKDAATGDFCDREVPVVTNHNIAVGTLLKVYEILGSPASQLSKQQSNLMNQISNEGQPIVDYREQLMTFAAEAARELHRADRHQFHAYVNDYVGHAPLSKLVLLYIGALGGREGKIQESSVSYPTEAPHLRAKDSAPIIRHSLKQWLAAVSRHVEKLEASQSGTVLRDISYILNSLAVFHPRLLRRVSVSCILDVVPSGFSERLSQAKSQKTAATAQNPAAAASEDKKDADGDESKSKEETTMAKFEKILQKYKAKDQLQKEQQQSQEDQSAKTPQESKQELVSPTEESTSSCLEQPPPQHPADSSSGGGSPHSSKPAPQSDKPPPSKGRRKITFKVWREV